MSRISLILHEAKAKLRPSVNIKVILRMQVGFNCLLSHKRNIATFDVTTDLKGFQQVAFDVATSTLYGLMHMLTVKPLSVLTLYGLGDMLDIIHVIC